tara:strand:- start:123548 stop:124342 length:795 start_codon:yes stop_codon:yes gene_type:complete
MTTLAELQRNFIRDCLSGKPSSTKLLLAKDIDTSLISASGLMGIYQGSSRANIIQAMKLTYPVIEKLVGEEFFRASCKKYILSHYPKSANMDDYGEEFAEFLACFEPAKQLTYLKNVAQLEWLFHLSSLASDSSPTEWNRLSAVAAGDAMQVKLLLAPSVKLISSPFPIDMIWQMNQPNSAVNKEIDLTQTVDKQTSLIVFRSRLKTQMLAVTEGEFALLSSFNQQQSLANAIEASIKIESNISIDEAIKKFIELNIISSFKVE